jgi:hypothetical protein
MKITIINIIIHISTELKMQKNVHTYNFKSVVILPYDEGIELPEKLLLSS